MLHFFLTAIAGMVFLLLFRVPIAIVAVLIWKARYILLVVTASLIGYLTWDYQSRAAVQAQQQQTWVEFLHSPDYAPGSPTQPLYEATINQQYQKYLLYERTSH